MTKRGELQIRNREPLC